MRLNVINSTQWVLDKKYLTSKMTISEDGLTYGNSASNGYPAIIGNLPFDTGVYVYEVTPTDLECTSKEGFGIIDLEEYKKVFSSDSTTPTCWEKMIGFMYRNTYKGMTAVKSADMALNTPYLVKVDLNEFKFIIKGKDVHLEAELKAGTVYVPCFSLGCRNNKLKIKVLDAWPE